ncbi:MAG: cell division protein FtsZ, partial [Oscillospiraceae bacterium]|nr:cell division protein FtsZ [Oscillospiraceae bacterium]
GFINLDFADVTAVMQEAGMAHMGVGRAAGKSKAEEAAKMAISSPLLETSINGARGVLVNITGSMDIGLEEVEAAADMVRQAAHPEALIIFGAAFDEALEDEMQVTVIATGYDEEAARLGANAFTKAGEKAAAEEKQAAETAEGGEETGEDKSSEDDDQWQSIFNIFNRDN